MGARHVLTTFVLQEVNITYEWIVTTTKYHVKAGQNENKQNKYHYNQHDQPVWQRNFFF